MWIFETLEKLRADYPTASAVTLLGLGAAAAWVLAWLILRQQLNTRADQIDYLRHCLKDLKDKLITPESAQIALEKTAPKESSSHHVDDIRFSIRLASWGILAILAMVGVGLYNSIPRINTESFPYIRAEIGDPAKLDQPVQLSLAVFGGGGAPRAAMWISPAAADRNPKNPAYWSMFGVYPEFVTPNGANLGVSIKPGEYWIEVDTQSGHIDQKLRLIEHKGTLIQLIDIYKDGKTVYSSPRPDDLSGR